MCYESEIIFHIKLQASIAKKNLPYNTFDFEQKL